MLESLRFTTAMLALALSISANASGACPPGQIVTADTAGQCCWPGQVWSRARKACVGTPTTCPAGLSPEGERCAKPCPAGQSVTEDTHGHCCWAGQGYSNLRQSCVGVPSACPAGLVAQEERCVKACPEGQLVTEDTQGQCCWPGQVFSTTRQSCVGVPASCPSGLAPEGESCGRGPAAPPAFQPAPYAPAPQPATQPQPGSQPVPPAPPPEAQPLPGSQPVPPAPPPDAQPLPTASQPGAQPQPASPAPPPAAAAPALTRQQRQAAKRAEAQARREREALEAQKSPRRVRVGLVGGFFAGAGLGAGVGLPVRIGLFRVLEGQPFQGLLSLTIEPWVFGGVRSVVGSDYLSLGLELNVTAGWEQRLGPIELFPRFGLSNGLNFQAALAGESNALFYLLRGLIGLRLAVPAGEGTKFLVGLDVHLGGEALWLAYVGVCF